MQHKGACREIHTARGEAECCMILETCITKCLNNLFLVIERTDRISLAVLVTYNVAPPINRAGSDLYLKGVVIRQSLSVYTIYSSRRTNL